MSALGSRLARSGVVGVGLDISSVAVEMARAKGIDARVADVMAPDFAPDRIYDTVLISEVLEHIAEPERVAVLFLTDRYGPDRLSGPASPSREYRPYLPPPRELLEATAKYGRLDRDIFRQGVVFPPSPYDLDRALWRLVGGVVVPTPGTEPGTACLTIDGPGAVLLPVRNSVTILGAGEWTIGLTRWAPPQPSDAVTITLADGWYTVRVPDLGDSAMYRLDMRPPRTRARICEAGVSG